MYSTDDLVQRAVQALRKMQKVEAAKVSFTTAELSVTNAGVEAHAVAAKTETVQYRGSLPDILAYLQNETELTRSTLVRILKESGRLPEFFVNPQRFMDSVVAILKSELHQLIVDGILIIVPASLRKQWHQELSDNFFLPSVLLETKTFNEQIRQGNLNPFDRSESRVRDGEYTLRKIEGKWSLGDYVPSK
jgi:restriction endonuclease